MKNNYSIVVILFLSNFCYSQKSYKIDFNYNKNTSQIYEIANDGKEIPKPKVRFKEGDIVTVKVNNYNPFKYKIIIKQSLVKQNPTSEKDLLEGITGAFGKVANISGFISMIKNPLNIEGGENRSEDNFKFIYENNEACQSYLSYLTKFNKDYKNYIENVSQINTYLESVKDPSKSKDELQILKIKLADEKQKLAQSSIKELLNEAYDTKELFAEAKFINDFQKVLEKSKEYTSIKKDDLVSIHHQNKSEYNKLLDIISNLETLSFQNTDSKLTTSVEDMIYAIDHLNYNTEKTFVVHTNQSSGLKNSSAEGVIYGINFEIEAYDLDKFNDLVNEEMEVTNLVKFYNPNRYINREKEILSKPCDDCENLVKAEGIIIGTEYPKVWNDEYLNECSNCIGKWKIYDDEGKLEKIIVPPSLTQLSGRSENNSQRELKIDDDAAETALSLKKTINMPVSGAVALNWNLGAFAVSPFKGRNSFQSISDNDSITIRSNQISPLSLSLGTLVSIELLSNKYIVPGLNFGATVNLMDVQSVNYLVGVSFKPKRFPFLCLSGGLSYSPNEVLLPGVTANTKYSISEINDLLDGSTQFTKKTYLPGYYFGIGVNF
jgi:hypothetical protein